jgi:hypothetical protein
MSNSAKIAITGTKRSALVCADFLDKADHITTVFARRWRVGGTANIAGAGSLM